MTFPIERTTATTAAALNNGMKRAVNVMRFAFITGTSIRQAPGHQNPHPNALPAEAADIRTSPCSEASVRNIVTAKESTQACFLFEKKFRTASSVPRVVLYI